MFQFLVKKTKLAISKLNWYSINLSSRTRNNRFERRILALFHFFYEYSRIDYCCLLFYFHNLEMEHSNGSKSGARFFACYVVRYWMHFHRQFVMVCSSFNIYLLFEGSPVLSGNRLELWVRTNIDIFRN